MPFADTEAMQAHLDEIGRTVARGAHAVLLLDRTGWQTTDKLRVPRNITLIGLAVGSPELNPVENISQYLRGNWLSNTVFETYDDVIDAACAARRKLTALPDASPRSDCESGPTSVNDGGSWYYSDWPDRPFDDVRIDLDAAVVEEATEACPAAQRVADCFGELALLADEGKFLAQPRLECVDYLPGPLLAGAAAFRARERIGAHRLAHQRRQAFCALAEVYRPGRHHHPDRAGWPDRAPLFKAPIIAAIVAADAPFSIFASRPRHRSRSRPRGAATRLAQRVGESDLLVGPPPSASGTITAGTKTGSVSPWPRATTDTTAPSTSVSSTIRARSSTLQRLRPIALLITSRRRTGPPAQVYRQA
jgi:hypothetical protein